MQCAIDWLIIGYPLNITKLLFGHIHDQEYNRKTAWSQSCMERAAKKNGDNALLAWGTRGYEQLKGQERIRQCCIVFYAVRFLSMIFVRFSIIKKIPS